MLRPAVHLESRKGAASCAPTSLIESFFTMKILSFSRPNRRSVLRDLYAFGILNVFRRHSIFRIWEPLREVPRSSDEFLG